MMICLNCGERDKFVKEVTYTEIVVEPHIINGRTEKTIDYGESETIESESQDSILRCGTCGEKGEEGGDNILCELDKEQILEIEAEHRDKNGKWHEEGIEDNRLKNKKILQKLFKAKI